ncbi:hypothetical protein HN954_04390 [bacterium]|jgi:hypothetical protein|nr:hypothetical protein [bacterium]MBT6831942.1 hypothetical protein [bacterium]MBT6996638.1 hypothetical protein [bacterium]MBT7773058.1 hypothetical protein [bacterium]
MKIQFFGGSTFGIQSKNAHVALDPPADFSEKKLDFVTTSTGENLEKLDTKKVLSFPGEFEISNILIRGIQPKSGNLVFKMVFDDVVFAHFSGVKIVSEKNILDDLGENVDVLLIALSESLDPKTAKKMIDELDPRMVIFGGDPQFFPEIRELTGAQIAEENPIEISRSKLPEDKTEFVILPA